jgi:hypothetical protein
MRRLLQALVMLLVFGGTAWADDWADCDQTLDYDLALRGCSNIIAAGRDTSDHLAQAYVKRAAAYEDAGQPGREIADLDNAIKLKPDYANAYSNRGSAYGIQGYDDRAISDFDKAIQFNPNDGYAYYGRGNADDRKGDPLRALNDFRVAARLIPESDPRHALAVARVTMIGRELAPVPAPAVPPAVAAPSSQGPAAAIGRRVALVIGNSAYRHVPALNNPVNDASLVATSLKADGFEVTVADNLDRDGLIDALKAFATSADNADWAVVYFAGHGIEMGGTNYLIPVDAKLLTDRDVELEAVPSGQVMHAIDGAHQLRVVILDACRNNPFADTIRRTAGGGRDIGRGLAKIEPARGTLVLYAAKEGTIAADGDGADSPFATALAKHLTEPGIEVDKMFRLVIDDVFDATGNKQEPFMYGSLPGRQDFYFRPRS